MHSFNELNLLESIEIRGLKVCSNEVCQITLWNWAKILELSFYSSFLPIQQNKSIAYDPRLFVALGTIA